MTNVPSVEVSLREKQGLQDKVSLREKRKQEVRSRIVDSAIILFSKHGCEDVTVEEICEAAEVARKTFYNYYHNKQDLLNVLSDELLLKETFNRIDLAMERYTTTKERLQFYFEEVAKNHENEIKSVLFFGIKFRK